MNLTNQRGDSGMKKRPGIRKMHGKVPKAANTLHGRKSPKRYANSIPIVTES